MNQAQKRAHWAAVIEQQQQRQAEFAATMGVSVDTVKSWEGKRRNPAGLAAKVLATIQQDPNIYAALAAH